MLWEHVEVSLNDRILNPVSSAYANYKSYMETILSYDDQARNGFLRAGLFALDNPGQFDTCSVGVNPLNPGYRERYNLVRGSGTFDMTAPIAADFLRCDNHLAPNNQLTIKLSRANDEFLLMRSAAAPTTYKLRILDLRIRWVAVRLSDTVPVPRIERYITTRTELGVESLPAGLGRKTISVFSGGKMPKSVIVAMVSVPY